ncbi:hypothetical protein [Chroogloeocystis siderophila]|jgi:hypothetical protein|uniref:Uncharacterized protein n=1 Tax=Chroogloeocystis siderophila 5.2 s.c.1 TaxID=247279 RepID=A0A1U7HIH1_9CHRO|nr:hypothetical protein [Chroogloeocystis siderophila]OKH23351.1 hypothetical protein NIES1031_18020 [Chroogloeocystis siderophila 5.2 s.c.1]
MSAVANGNQTLHKPEQKETEVKPKRSGNPLMKVISPDMLSNPYPLDFMDEMMSNEFCYEKANKQLLQPLGFKTEKEWLAFCKQVWIWSESAQERESEAIANQFLSQYQNNTKIIEVLKQKLSERTQ